MSERRSISIPVRLTPEEHRRAKEMADGKPLAVHFREKGLEGAGETVIDLQRRIEELDQIIYDMEIKASESRKEQSQLRSRMTAIQNQQITAQDKRMEILDRVVKKYGEKSVLKEDRFLKGWLTSPAMIGELREAEFEDAEEAISWMQENMER